MPQPAQRSPDVAGDVSSVCVIRCVPKKRPRSAGPVFGRAARGSQAKMSWDESER